MNLIKWVRNDNRNLYYGELTREFVLPNIIFKNIDNYIKFLELKEKRFERRLFEIEYSKVIECLI